MIVCVCRKISDKDIETHVAANPHLLGQEWNVISFQISGKAPVCADGKGHCTDYANGLMELCGANLPCPQ